MSSDSKYNKADFIRFFISEIEHVSSDKETARAYLESEGYDPSSLTFEIQQKIKKLLLQIEARKTKKKMASAKSNESEIREFVKRLKNNPSFSFKDFIAKENPAFSFSNFQSFNDDEITEILVQHYKLKFLSSDNSDLKK